MQWRRVVSIPVFIGAATGLGSCAAPVIVTAGLTVAQTGAAAYESGVLESAVAATFDESVSAIDAALIRLEFSARRRSTEGRKLTIVYEELGGRNITVTVIKKTPVVTKINIRVGLFGDQSMSRMLLTQIQKEFQAMGVGDPGAGPISGVPLFSEN